MSSLQDLRGATVSYNGRLVGWRASLRFQEITVLGSFYGIHIFLDSSSTVKKLDHLEQILIHNWSDNCIFCKVSKVDAPTPPEQYVSSYLNLIISHILCLNTFSQEHTILLKLHQFSNSENSFGIFAIDPC